MQEGASNEDNPDEAREVNVVKYWLNAEEILAPRLCDFSGYVAPQAPA